MRTIFSWVLALLPWVAAAQELEPGKIGYIRLVHAVAPGEGLLKLELDGADIYPDGYELGAVTGGIGVATGRCKVRVTKEGVKPGETEVEVEAGGTTTVIPFAERIPATDDEPAHWQVRILRLKQVEEEQGRNATFVSVAAQPELAVEMRDPDGTWNKYFVKRFGTTRAPMKYPEGYVPLRLGERELPAIPVMDEGNYVVVLHNDGEGEVGALSFRDFKELTAE